MRDSACVAAAISLSKNCHDGKSSLVVIVELTKNENHTLPGDVEGALAESSVTADAHSSLAQLEFLTELTHLATPPPCRHLVQGDSTQFSWLHILYAGRVQGTHHVHPTKTGQDTPTSETILVSKIDHTLPAMYGLFEETTFGRTKFATLYKKQTMEVWPASGGVARVGLTQRVAWSPARHGSQNQGTVVNEDKSDLSSRVSSSSTTP